MTGNHGFTGGSTQVVNWPETNAAAGSGGRYLMEQYPAIDGSKPTNYPSMWYAFDAGPARFYALTVAWSDSNIGTTNNPYQNDRDAHWTVSSAEYQWLKADLAAHPNALKFAFWHYPLYADSGGQPSDTFLQGGTGTLQGLLDQYGVAVAFNGHAHGYERNKPDSAGLVSYVLGNGGAAMGSVSGCSSFDAYAIGSGGSHCGAAPAGLSLDHVFGFAKVTVNGHQVTVTPTDEMGRTFDIQTYNFSTGPADTVPPTPPTTVTATAVSTSKIDLSWSGATDNVGVTGYRVFRDGVQIAEQAGTSYTDATVTPGPTYQYTIVAIDAAGNLSAPAPTNPATVSTTGAPDGTPPTQPGSLNGSAPSSSQVNLSWLTSTDNVAVTGYRVYRNGVPLPTAQQSDATPPTSYTDDTASPGITYTYGVSAVDAAGNESSQATASVTTPGGGGGGTLLFTPTDDATVDASQPTANFGSATRLTVDNSPFNYSLLKFIVAGTSGCAINSAKLRLTVGGTTNDNSAYGGDLYGTTNGWAESNVTWNTAPAAGATKVSSVSTAVALNTTYLFDVTPLVTGDGTVSMLIKSTNSDGARYYSKESGTATQTPQLQVACAGDTTPPSQPGNLLATASSSTQVGLTWSASTDNVGVTGYKVFRNLSATALATLPADSTSYTDGTAKPATTYSYQVTALDAVGNQSSKASATVTTPPAGNDFTIAASPTSLTVATGGTGTSTISTSAIGTPMTVNLSATGQPTGVTVGFSPASVTAGNPSTLTMTVAAGAAPGTYPITLTGASSVAHTATVTLTVPTPVSNDFTIAAAPATLTVAAGQSGTATISTNVSSGAAETVSFTASGQPASATLGFSPASVNAGGSSALSVAVPAGTASGSYPITVTGTSTSAAHSVAVTLTVTTTTSSAPQLVQSAAGTATSTATSLTATFANPTTAGNLLVLSASVYTGATNHLTSVTDSANNSWTRIGAYAASGHNSDGELWYAAGALASTTVTVHTSAAASIVFQVQEFSGVAATSPLDTSVGASNTGTTPSSGPIAPTGPHDLVIGMLAGHGNSQAMTITTPGYKAQTQQVSTASIVTVQTGYQVLSSPSSISIAGSFATSMYWAAGVVAFKAAS